MIYKGINIKLTTENIQVINKIYDWTNMNTLYKQIPEWENPNNYKEVMIDINDSNPIWPQ